MTKDNTFYAYLTFFGDFDLGELSEKLELQPSHSWRKGDRNDKTMRERTFSRWNLRTRLDEKLPLFDHIRDVLDQLRDKFYLVRRARVQYEGCMQLVANFHSETPWFHFDEDIVSACAAMNLSIDCDFYTLYSDRRDDSE